MRPCSPGDGWTLACHEKKWTHSLFYLLYYVAFIIIAFISIHEFSGLWSSDPLYNPTGEGLNKQQPRTWCHLGLNHTSSAVKIKVKYIDKFTYGIQNTQQSHRENLLASAKQGFFPFNESLHKRGSINSEFGLCVLICWNNLSSLPFTYFWQSIFLS